MPRDERSEFYGAVRRVPSDGIYVSARSTWHSHKKGMKFFYIYVLQSFRDSSCYIGFTENLKQRFEDHNSGKNPSTKYKVPFELIYFEGYRNKSDALGREKFLKSGSGWRFIRKQLTNFFGFDATNSKNQLAKF